MAAWAPRILSIPEPVRADMRGRSHHQDPRCPAFESLRLLELRHMDFAGSTQRGELVVAAELAQELLQIFEELYALAFPIASLQRIDAFDGDDNRSMAANNSSAFNFRVIEGTHTLSRHALGRAVDINPVQNPWLRGERVDPAAGRAYLDRTHVRPGMITVDGPVVAAFTRRGYVWGGSDVGAPDYHHFAK